MTSDQAPNAAKPKQNLTLIMLATPVVFGLAVGGGILYGKMQRASKAAALETSADCAGARALAPKLDLLSRGEVAAMNIGKTPKPAVDIHFLDAKGAPVSLASFKGKTVLLNLWATWCVPCRQEMPALDRLQAARGGDNFAVVAVNIDTARLEKRQAFLDEAGIKSLAFYADPTADVFQRLKQAGKVLGLPTSILVDAKGCELGVLAGPADWGGPDALKLVDGALGG